MTRARWPVLAFALFVVLVLWTQAQPFASLSDYGVLDDPTRSNTLRRNLTLLLLAISLLMVWRAGQGRLLWQAVSPGLVGIFVWFSLTALISGSAGLALNRLALAGVVIALAVCLPLLLQSRDEFIALLGIAASAAILLSFAGAIFIPDLAIHSLRDTVEQGLAGDWRGIFRHKNDLAPMSIHFGLIGMLLWRTQHPLWGGLVMVSSLALLLLSGGKSAALLALPAVLGAGLMLAMPTRRRMGAVALVLVGGVVALTVGSVAIPVLGAVTAQLPDPSFTGRSDIWRLALEAVNTRPITGYGYGVFWDTGVTYSLAGSSDTAAQVSHAHNGYLEVAIAAGLPGLALVLAWAGLAPITHIARIRERQLDRIEAAFLHYLAANWLFTLLISCLEAVLFNRGDSVWFTGLLAIVCLRLWGQHELRR